MKNRLKHPELNPEKAFDEDSARRKAVQGKGIGKQVSSLKAAEGTGETTGVMQPNDEQLAKINEFTRSPKTAEELVVFRTMSCNDLVDRDDDQFTTQCVKDFAALEQPYSPVGKSFMLDHDYTVSKQLGRIFEVGTEKAEGGLFLTNEVYIPNTAKNQGHIEDIDFGVNWAVSVGVMLGKDSCTVCGEGFSSFGWWCRNGHDKGLTYDPNSTETDDWGWPIPTEDGSGIKCIRQFSDPRDYYELSMVFLGAQYFASIDKSSGIAKVMKSAPKGQTIINLSADEVKELPMGEVHEKVTEARKSGFDVTFEEGLYKWIDDDRFMWTFDPETSESLNLGRAASEEDEPVEEDVEDTEGAEDEEVDTTASAEDENEDDTESEDTPVPDPNEEDEEMDKAAVVALAKSVGVPVSTIEKIESVKDGNGLESLLKSLVDENVEKAAKISELEPKAALGAEYIKGLRADAIDWYVKSHRSSETEGVNTDTVQRLVDACGDNTELITALRDEYKTLAQAKFPGSVRRSSFPDNVNERDEEKAPAQTSDSKVSRLHG